MEINETWVVQVVKVLIATHLKSLQIVRLKIWIKFSFKTTTKLRKDKWKSTIFISKIWNLYDNNGLIDLAQNLDIKWEDFDSLAESFNQDEGSRFVEEVNNQKSDIDERKGLLKS